MELEASQFIFMETTIPADTEMTFTVFRFYHRGCPDPVEDKDVVAGGALVIISVKEIVSLDLVSASVFPSNRTGRGPLQGKG